MSSDNSRPDIRIEDVVQRWLFQGEPILAIAISYDVAVVAINRRIHKARERWPDLPWSERKANRALSPTKEWLHMMDGLPGERETVGSIVRGRRYERR